MGRITKYLWALELAKITSKRSTCYRRQVGCVLLNERGHVLSTGYNGVASGLPHCNEIDPATAQYKNLCPGAMSESGKNLDACQAIHAEQNALLQCSDVYQIYTCFVTASPCMTCTKLLLNTSCQRIVFIEDYPHKDAEKLWIFSGRLWEKVTLEAMLT